MALAVLLVSLAAPAWAQLRVTAAWDPSADGLTAGYRVSVGTSPGSALATVDVGLATSVALPLPVGSVYFISVRGYSAAGVEGPPSVEATVDLSAPPGAPDAFSADVNGASASLGWGAPGWGGAPLTYLLSVGTQPGAANLVNGLSVGDVRRVSGELPPGQYFATVRAANLVGVGPASTEISFQVGGGFQPAPPSSLQASVTGTLARLSWAAPQSNDPSVLPTSYVVEAGSRAGASDLGSVNVGNTTSFAVNVPPGVYYVRVRGVNARGLSAPSNEVLMSTGGAVPGAPRGLTSSGSGSAVNLRWNAVTGAASYVVEAGSQPGLSNLGTFNVGSATSLSTSAPAGTYYVRVRAANAAGIGPASNEIIVRR